MTTTTINEDDCRMILQWDICVQCRGRTTITREVEAFNPKRLVEIEVECPNCHGEGEVAMEACNACRLSEDECRCLDGVGDELETTKETMAHE